MKRKAPRTWNRGALYVAMAACSYAMATLRREMLGSESAHAWTMFGLGLVNAVCLAIRSYIDRTPSDEADKLANPSLPASLTLPGNDETPA